MVFTHFVTYFIIKSVSTLYCIYHILTFPKVQWIEQDLCTYTIINENQLLIRKISDSNHGINFVYK